MLRADGEGKQPSDAQYTWTEKGLSIRVVKAALLLAADPMVSVPWCECEL